MSASPITGLEHFYLKCRCYPNPNPNPMPQSNSAGLVSIPRNTCFTTTPGDSDLVTLGHDGRNITLNPCDGNLSCEYEKHSGELAVGEQAKMTPSKVLAIRTSWEEEP